MQVAEVFGADITNANPEDAGAILSDALRNFLASLGDQPMGIKALGYSRSDIPALVESTLPQRRVLMLAPGFNEDIEPQVEALSQILEDSIDYS